MSRERELEIIGRLQSIIQYDNPELIGGDWLKAQGFDLPC